MEILQSIIAVDLGGTKILVGEVTPAGEVLQTKSYPSDTTSQHTALQGVIHAINDFQDGSNLIAREQIAIGLGVVGRVDTHNGVWHQIQPGKTEPMNVSEQLESIFQLPCGVDNDVACATRAEQTFGWGRQSKNFIYFNIGTGIAAGTVVDGHYVEGNQFNAGEVGHMVVAMDSDVRCGCGRYGCVERIASGLGMHERVVALLPNYPSSSLELVEGQRIAVQTILEAAAQADPLASRIVDDAARAAAAAIMNLVRVTDPDTIVLGGGVARNPYFFERVKQALNPSTVRFVANGLVYTKVGSEETGLVGAALAGLQASRSRRGGN
ncbi:ROK family protein [Paenibacillus curdlanolyticus YK9]|uniref:ROK family protein n=1 Tax=Paenibacillus curdlanolyticus YK9 TaxID=717606 RepID=E0ID58_9BACL|nr:ROK family protein [Paenibacillus curdlanolyticus]EFM09513.1 ROK family protein [Paenibacillus curdlanolyticus YK9]